MKQIEQTNPLENTRDFGDRLSVESSIGSPNETESNLRQLSNVARSQPELMYKSITQLQDLIADTTDDPRTQGRAFLNLAKCYIGVAGNKIGQDPEGARIVMYGTPQGRTSPDHNGKTRGYDGAVDALKAASKRLPRDSNITNCEDMIVILARKLQH
jgi:hypothetical protein